MPHPWSRMERLRPALARTFRPGFSAVPLAERTMLPIRKLSITTVPWFLAISVDSLWRWSFRARAMRACNVAMRCFCFLHPLESFTLRASFRRARDRAVPAQAHPPELRELHLARPARQAPERERRRVGEAHRVVQAAFAGRRWAG